MLPSYKFNVWIGLTDTKKERKFLWKDETDFDFENWDYGQPDGRWSSYYQVCTKHISTAGDLSVVLLTIAW